MLKAIIIDDEQNARDVIATILRKHCPEVEVAGTADSVESGRAAIQKIKPDLVLLDIHLKDGSGFELLSKVKLFNFRLIFISAYKEYALKAFKFSALDYILKPIHSRELVEAVQRASALPPLTNPLQVNTLRENYTGAAQKPGKIILKTLDTIHAAAVEDIVRCEADAYYSTVYLKDKSSIVISRPLKDLDEMLRESGFFRVHQSHLINLTYFVKYKKGDGGFAVLRDGTEIPVSSRKKESFLQALAKL